MELEREKAGVAQCEQTQSCDMKGSGHHRATYLNIVTGVKFMVCIFFIIKTNSVEGLGRQEPVFESR